MFFVIFKPYVCCIVLAVFTALGGVQRAFPLEVVERGN